jgi:hypothetical protein
MPRSTPRLVWALDSSSERSEMNPQLVRSSPREPWLRLRHAERGSAFQAHTGMGGFRKTGPVANGLKSSSQVHHSALGIRLFSDRNRTSWPSNEQNEGQSKRRCSGAPGSRSRSRSIDGSMEVERNNGTVEVKMAGAC